MEVVKGIQKGLKKGDYIVCIAGTNDIGSDKVAMVPQLSQNTMGYTIRSLKLGLLLQLFSSYYNYTLSLLETKRLGI